MGVNRQRSQAASKKKFWCCRCDASLVGEWGKCRKCGTRNGTKKKVKAPIQEET